MKNVVERKNFNDKKEINNENEKFKYEKGNK